MTLRKNFDPEGKLYEVPKMPKSTNVLGGWKVEIEKIELNWRNWKVVNFTVCTLLFYFPNLVTYLILYSFGSLTRHMIVYKHTY